MKLGRMKRPMIPGLAALIMGIGSTQESHAVTRQVPRDYPTIQQAVDASADFDTVLVGPGTYRENISTLYVHLRSLEGAAATVIESKDDQLGYVIQATSRPGWLAPTLILGFTIRGADQASGAGVVGGGSGAGSQNGPALHIRDCIITGNATGVLFEASGALHLEHNVIIGNSRAGVILGKNDQLPGPAADVAYNLIAQNESGIQIPFNFLYRINHNTIRSNATAIDASTAGLFYQCRIDRNIIADNGRDYSYTNTTDRGCNILYGNGQTLRPISPGDIMADPRFCEPAAGDYRVEPTSPALATACGPIGAYGVGCGPTAVEAITWTGAKGLYK